MILDNQLLENIQATIGSGYYERNLPVRREKRSLVEAIEKTHASGQLPFLLEVCTAIPGGDLLRPTRNDISSLIDLLAQHRPTAFSLWVEPKFHAGDLRWLAKDKGVPILCKDWIIDARQIVGGDAILLNLPLVRFAGSDEHALVEAAHGQDMEVAIEVYTPEQLLHAKETEADILLINNYGSNGTVDINTTVQMLVACRTGRPVISSQGIIEASQVRALVSAGATAIELAAKEACGPDAPEYIRSLCRAVLGRDPPAAPAAV